MPKEKKVEPTQIVSYVDSNYIIDLAKDELGLHFWEQNGLAPKKTLGSRPKKELHLVPIKDPFNIIDTGVIVLPSQAKSYNNQSELLERMIEFIHRYLDCSPDYEPLIAHYCLLTWVYDRFSAVPYLRFLDDYGQGKSRKLAVCHRLSYKGIMTMGATTASPIFRLIDRYRGTLILDEADWNNSDMRNDFVQLMNTGYSVNGFLLRSVKTGNDFEPKPFKTFSPKVIANRARFEDSALESRCLTIQESERDLRKDIPRQLNIEIFDKEALEIRNQLLSWRFDHFRNIKVNEEPLKMLDPRVCEVGSTLYSVSQDDKFKQWLLDFLSDIGRRDKEDRPRTRVAKLIVENCPPGIETPYKVITAAYNETEDERNEQLSPRKLGTYIKSLGIMNVRRTMDGYILQPTNDDIERLKKKY